MKLTFKCALSLVLGLSLAGGVIAQDSFPDVADTHWASEAIKRLKLEKFINGYPDGNFQGLRNVTRYEMASMLYMIYNKGICFNEEIDAKIKALEAKINSFSGPTQPEDHSDLIKAIRADMASIRAWKSDIDMVKKMMESYQKELMSLGVDLKKMRADLDEIQARMNKVSGAKTDGVTIKGDANFFVAAGFKDDGFATGINQDGRFTQGNAQGAGLTNLTVLHELGLNLSSSAGTPWVADVVVGNALNNGLGGLGNQSQFEELVGTPYTMGNTSLYLHRAVAHTKLGTIGRQGVALSPYILRRFDNTSFYSNQRWDDGKYMLDGVTFGIGGNRHDSAGDRVAAANTGMVFLGRANNVVTTATGNVQPLGFGGFTANRVMGATYNLGLGGSSGLSASYVLFDGDTAVSGGGGGSGSGSTLVAAGSNRQEVYGLDFESSLGKIGAFGKSGNARLFAGWGQATNKFNSGVVADNDNQRLNAGIGLGPLFATYHRVEANYDAPGDWGRVGLLRNLRDVQAFTVGTGANSGFGIGGFTIGGQYSKGEGINGPGEYDSVTASLSRALTPKWGLRFDYELTRFDGGFGGLANNAYAKFRTVGLMYDLGSDRIFNLYYQHGDTVGVASAPGIGSAQRGGFLGAQYGVRF